MELQEMSEQCLQDSEEWFPEHARDPFFLMLAMMGEMGEACNVMKKVMRGSITMADATPQLHEEMVDILIYWMNAAAAMGINIERVYDDKRRFNQARFGHGSRRAV